MKLALNLNRRYTYADYLTWNDNELRELLNGFIRQISPPHTPEHDIVLRKITDHLNNCISENNNRCRVFCAPFDVRLPKSSNETADNQIYTVVQPDICLVCDSDNSKIDVHGCLGAPDLVVEILTLASQRYDLNEKFNLYEAAGVKEYWVVSPKEKGINVFILQEDGEYDVGTVYEGDTQVPVQTLEGLTLSMEEIFNE